MNTQNPRISLSSQIGAVELVISAAKSGGLSKTHARDSERAAILANAAQALETLKWLQANRDAVLAAAGAANGAVDG